METPGSPLPQAAHPSAALAAPVITVSTPFSGIAGTTVTLTGTGFTGATSVTFGGVPATSFNVVSATQITAVAPAGAGTVQIVVTTSGGTSNGINFTYATATAVITSVVPNQGPVAGGNTVTVSGSGFTGATAVRFGTTNAGFITVSPTQITAYAPAGPAGTVNVTVVTPGGTSNGVPYSYVNVPTLSGVVPSQGPLAGTNTVTLTGTNLTGATAVSFGGHAATSFTVVSATQITAVVPSGSPGGVPVTVTTPGGTTAGTVFYFYVAPPTLTAATPGSGAVAGGTSVTLTGTNLLGTTAVLFGATAATSFTVVSDTQINAVAPAGAGGTVAVTVTTPGGPSNGVAYTYVGAPTVSSVAPNQGPLSGGNTVTLTGTNLTGVTTVQFGGVFAGFTVISDTQLTATVPAGAAGTVNVTVTAPGGTSAGVPYTRLAPPGI
ncbi:MULTISPECIES: IPT/TIG domain-containing protein [unclassified Streptomyces]|uniref:IPT/TIG domain-containing protein n=1 Tax=unclassified Streptomyces TaxID=2593676 RepID=UPI003651A12B